MLVAKKILHSALAFIVSVCMVLTLTPASAWAATEGSGTVGKSERVTIDSIGPDGIAVGHGSTAIIARVYTILGKFIEITAPENYNSIDEAIAAVTGANADANKNHEIAATIQYSKDTPVPANGDGTVTFKVTWTVRQLAYYDSVSGQRIENPGYESAILVKEYNVPRADIEGEVTADLLFDLKNDPDAVGRLRQVIHSINTVYEVKASLDDGDYITTEVGIIPDYKYATMDDRGNIEAPIDWGIMPPPGATIESNTNIAGYFKPGTTLTTTKANSALDANLGSAFQVLNSAATNNEPTELIEEAVAFNVNKPAGVGADDKWPPYIMDLTVHLSINEKAYNQAVGAIDKDGKPVVGNKDKALKVGDIINVYWYPPNATPDPETGEVKVEVLQARVVLGVDAKDADGNSLGNLAAEVIIGGTGAALGVFAVGYPTTETYDMTTQVEGPGSIFPVLNEGKKNTTLSCALPQPIVMNPLLPGYVVSKVTVTATDKNDNPVALKTVDGLTANGATGEYVFNGPLAGNTITINPEQLGIMPGYQLTVTAHFTEAPAEPSVSQVTIQAVAENGAKGKVTATYDTMGAAEQSKVTVVTDGIGPDASKGESASPFGPTEMVSKDGIFLEFNPSDLDIFNPDGATYKLKSLTINGETITVDGLSYFLSAIPANAVIVATFTDGAPSTDIPSYEVEADWELSNLDDAPADAVPAEFTGTGTVSSGSMRSVVAKNLSKGKDKYILTSVVLYPEGQEATESGEDENGDPIAVAPGIPLYKYNPADPDTAPDPNLITVTDAEAVAKLYNIVSGMRLKFTYQYVEADPLATLTIPDTIEDGTTTPLPADTPIDIYDDATEPVKVTITPDTDYAIDEVMLIQKDNSGNKTAEIDLADESNWPERDDGTKINPLVPVDPTDPSKGVTVNFVSDPEKDFGAIFEITVPSEVEGEPDKTIVVVNIAGDTSLEPTFVDTRENVATVVAWSSTTGATNTNPLTNESDGGSVSAAEVEVPFSETEPGRVTFTVLPNDGYEVAGITVAGGTTDTVTIAPDPVTDLNTSDAPTFTVSGITAAALTAEKKLFVTVTFKTGTHEPLEDTFNVTTAETANGTISPEERTVYKGDEPVFNLMPKTGYKIGAVVVEYPDPDGGESTFVTVDAKIPSGDGTGNGTATLPAVTQNAIVHVSFVPLDTNTTDPDDPNYDTGLRYVKITKTDPSNNDGNKIDPSGLVLCALGTTLTMTPAFASDAYSIESWTISGTTQTSTTYTYTIDNTVSKDAMEKTGAIPIDFKFKKTVIATIPGDRVTGQNATEIKDADGTKTGTVSTGSTTMTTTDDGTNTITVPEKDAADTHATATLTPNADKEIGGVLIVVDDPDNPGTPIKIDLISNPDFKGSVEVGEDGVGTIKVAYDPTMKDGDVKFDKDTGIIYVGGAFDFDITFDDPDISVRDFAPIKALVDGDKTYGSVSPTDTAAYFETGTKDQDGPNAVKPVPGSATISVFPESGKSVESVTISYAENTHTGLKATVDGTHRFDVTNGVNIADLVNALNNSDKPKITIEGVLHTDLITVTVKFKDEPPAVTPEDKTHLVNTEQVEGEGVIVPSAPVGEEGIKVYDGDKPTFQLEPAADWMVGTVWVDYITTETVQPDSSSSSAGTTTEPTTVTRHNIVKSLDFSLSDGTSPFTLVDNVLTLNGFEKNADGTVKGVGGLNCDAVVYVTFVKLTDKFEPGKDPNPELRWVEIVIGEGGTAEDGCAVTGVYPIDEEITLKFSPETGNRFKAVSKNGAVIAKYNSTGELEADQGSITEANDGVITFVYPKEHADIKLEVSFIDEKDIPKFVKVPSDNITINGNGVIIKERSEDDGSLEFEADNNVDPKHAKGDGANGAGDVTLTLTLTDGMTFDPSNPVEYTDKDGNVHKVALIRDGASNGTYQIKIPAEAITADRGPSGALNNIWTSDFKLTINTKKDESTERPDYQRINIRIIGDGKVTPSAKTEGVNTYISYVVPGDSQTLNFIPDNGWWLQSVLIDGVLSTELVTNNADHPYTYTFDNLRRDVWIDVTFANTPQPPEVPDPPTLLWTVDVVVVNGGAGGQIIPAISSTQVYNGNALSVIAQPNAGYTMKAYMKSESATQPAGLSVSADGNVVKLDPVTQNYTNGNDGPLYVEFVQEPTSQYAAVDVSITNEKDDTIGHPYGTVSPFGHLTLIAGTPLTISTAPSIENGYTLDKIVVTKKDGTASTYVPDYTAGMSMEQLLAYKINAVEDGMKVEVTFRVRMENEPEPIVDYYDINVKYAGNGYGSAEPDALHAVKNSDNTISLLPVVGSFVDKVEVRDAAGNLVSQGPDTWSLGADSKTVNVKAIGDLTVVVTFTKGKPGHPDPEDDNYYTVRMVWSTYVKGSDGSYSYSDNFKEGGTVSPATNSAATASGKVSPVTEVRVPSGGSATFSLFNKQDFKPQIALSPDLTDGKDIHPENLTFGKIDEDKTFWDTPGYTAFNVTNDMVLYIRFVTKQGNPATVEDPNNSITASSSVGGTISPSGSVPVAKGANATFSMEPDKGYELSYLLVDGKVVYPGDVQGMQYTFKNVQEAHTIKAVFKTAGTNPEVPDGLTQLNINTGTNGSTNPTGTVTVPAGNGQNFPIEFTPSYGYELDLDNTHVTGPDGQPLTWHVDKDTGNIIIPNLPTGKVNVDIAFRPIEGTPENPPAAPDYARLTTVVQNVGTASGMISYGPGTTYLEKFAPGTNLSISLAPAQDCIAGEIIIEPTGLPKRTITDTPSGSTETIYTVATKGYFNVTAEELNSGVTVTVIFRAMTEDERDKATDPNDPFKPLPEDKFASVKLTKSGLGVINPDGERKVAPGTSLMVTMIPSVGYELSEFTVNKKNMMDQLGAGSAAAGDGIQSMMYKLDVPADGGRYDVHAKFTHTKIDPSKIYKVTTKISGTADTGTISPMGTFDVPMGGSLPVFMYPKSGFKIAKIEIDRGDGKPVVITNYKSVSYTVSNVKSNVTVTVSFGTIDSTDPDDKNPADGVERVEVNVKDAPGGKVSPSGTLDVPKGSVIDFNIMPDDGKAVQAVIINGERIPIKPGTTTYPIRFDDSVLKDGKCEVQFEFVNSDQAVDPGDDADLSDVNVNVNVSVSVDVNTNVSVGSESYGFAECDASPKSFKGVRKGDSVNFYLLPAPGWTIEDVSVDPSDATTPNDNIDVRGGARDLNNLDTVIEPLETQKMEWDPVAKKWIIKSTTRGNLSTSSVRDADAGTTGLRAVSALDKFDFGSESKNGVFYSTYTASLKGIQKDAEVNVTMIPIDAFCDNNGIDKDDITYHKYLSHTVTVDSIGGGTVTPFGKSKVLDGQSMTLEMTPFASYYISSVEVTRTVNGKTVKEDMTNRVLNGRLTLENITSDMQVLVTFEKVGLAKLVNVRLDSAKVEVYDPTTGEVIGDPVDVDLKDVVVGTDQTSGKINPLKLDGDGYILGSDGERLEYEANTHGTFYFDYTKFDYPDGSVLDGMEYVLKSVDYAGEPQSISAMNVYPSYTLTKLPVTGGFDVVFRLAKTDAIPDMYKIYPSVEGEGGRISPSAIQNVEPGGSIAFAFMPEDHWMVDEVVVTNRDTDEVRTLAASEYTRGGVYSYTFENVSANYDIVVSFCEAIYLTTDWEQTEGFIAPNGKGSGDLRVKKGSSVEFLIAPYSNNATDYYDVKAATFDENSVEVTQRKSVHDEFKQSQAGANRLESLTKLKAESAKDGVKIGHLTAGVSSDAKTASDMTAMDAANPAAAAPAENFGLNVKPLGSAYKTVYTYTTPTLEAGDSTLAVEFERTQLATDSFTLTAIVEGGNGQVTPTVYTEVRRGDSRTFVFTPDNGFWVGQIKVDDGAFEPYRSASYTFSNVEADHTITVKFARSLGSGSYIDRVSKTVGSMLRTGDLNNVVLAGLIGVAALAFLITGLSIVRKNKKRREEE